MSGFPTAVSAQGEKQPSAIVALKEQISADARRNLPKGPEYQTSRNTDKAILRLEIHHYRYLNPIDG